MIWNPMQYYTFFLIKLKVEREETNHIGAVSPKLQINA